MSRLILLGLFVQTLGNDLLQIKKERKENRIQQRRKTATNEKKFVDPAIFAKFKQEMQSGAFKGLIRPVTQKPKSGTQMPPRIQKARPYLQSNRVAEKDSMQFGDWTDRFAGARATTGNFRPTARPLANRYGPRPFMKDSKSFGRSAGRPSAIPVSRPPAPRPQKPGSPFEAPAWGQRSQTQPSGVRPPFSQRLAAGGQRPLAGQRAPLGQRPTGGLRNPFAPTPETLTSAPRRFPMSSAPSFNLKVAQPQWSQAATFKTSKSTTRPTTVFNMCLNGGIYQLGVGCLCVGNFGGDFCDECIPGWNGQKCDNPANLCTISAVAVDCSSRWLFNLTLLNMPTTAKNINMEFNGLIKSGAFRKKISHLKQLEQINLKGNYFARFPMRMFANQPQLKMLNVASNFLFALPLDIFQDVPEIETIDFKNNNIKTINMTMFTKNLELKTLDFSNNNLSQICKGLFAYQTKLQFVAFNRNDDLPLPLNKWFGSCPYDKRECDKSFPQSQFGGPIINLRRRIGAFGESCN